MTELKPIRVAVATALTDREIASTGVYNTDSMLVNCYVETQQGRQFVVKRPGLTTTFTYNGGGATNGQGTVFFKGSIYAMGSNTLYRVSGSGNGSTDGSAWTAATAAPWAGRERYGCIVFGGQIFVCGGQNAGGIAYLNDVWSSPDAQNWTQVVSAAPWAKRATLKLAVLGNTLYVIGGTNASGNMNDVWSTTDGVNWNQVVASAPWEVRQGHAVVTFNQGIFLMGGLGNAAFLNDVWFSPDGATWTQMVQNAAWSARVFHTAIVYNGKMWVAGGNNGAILQSVYSSPDGIIWTNTGNLPAIRELMAACVYANKIFFLGGLGVAANPTTTVWSTTDGATFSVVTAAYGGTAISGAELVSFDTPASVNSMNAPTMWLIGGNAAGATNAIYRATLNIALASSFPIATAGANTAAFKFATQNAGAYLVFKNNSDAWVLYAGIVQKITSPNYPQSTVPGIVNLDDTLYVMDANGVIYGSNLSDPFTWSSLNFITADYESDTGVAIWKYQTYIVAFKSTTLQFFYDAGRYPGSPLLPVPNANARVGCASAGSIVEMDNTLVFMANTNDYGRYIAMLNGQNPQRISTDDVDRILDSWLASDSIYAFSLRINGHDFYVLTLVARAITLAYDIQEKRWHQWQSGSTYFTASNYVTDGFLNYLQDLAVGKLYSVNPSAYTDDGAAINATGVGDMVDGGVNTRKFCGSLTVIGDRRCNSVPNNLTVSWADDDEQTFSSGVTVDLSMARPRINRLGSFRRRRFKFAHASNNPMRLEAYELQLVG